MSARTSIKEYYGAIDGLRAFAAIGVVMMHVLKNGNYEISGFIVEQLIGKMGEFVYLFMIISAFAICCGYYEKILYNEISIGDFYSKRYKKIWPYFALLCLMDVAVSPSREVFYELFANLTLCFGLLPNANISVIGVGWFLGVVFVFYLLFPFWVYILSNKKRMWFSVIIALIYNVLCVNYFMNAEHVVQNYDKRTNFVYCAIYFLVGGVIFLYKNKLGEWSGKYRWICLSLCVFSAFLYFSITSNLVTRILLYGILLIYAIGKRDERGILLNSCTKFISHISMEIYLCHMLFYRVVEKLHLTHAFGNEVLSYVVTVGVILGLSIVFSYTIKKIYMLINSHTSKKEFGMCKGNSTHVE